MPTKSLLGKASYRIKWTFLAWGMHIEMGEVRERERELLRSNNNGVYIQVRDCGAFSRRCTYF